MIQIGVVPVEPGMTNSLKESPAEKGKRIVGFNSENAEINEGLVRFDIVFYVSRPVSSQKERDFVNTNYNDIQRVFSIWVLMNLDENSMGHVHLAYDKLIGDYQCKGRLDLLNIVLIGLSNELPEHDEQYELHRLLGALLSKQLSVDEKLSIIGEEYDIPVENNVRRDISVMCNLSQGIREDAQAEFIMNMYRKGYTLEQIADVTEKSVKEIKAIIEKREPALV
ncbi:MAG: hypothetical protein NC398_07715 [Acetatifactor muris]|nr:hypothetical protein [Acetatifactor muris]MCM1527298.1 hypothetical protein [Bacteroides sp.]